MAPWRQRAALFGASAEVATLQNMGAEAFREPRLARNWLGVAAAGVVAPILVHRAPRVHDPGNMEEEEIEEARKRRRLLAPAVLRSCGEASAGQAVAIGQCLLDPDAEIRREAVATLRALGAGAAVLAGCAAEGGALEARVLAIEALGHMGVAAMDWIPGLAACLEDKAPEVRRQAAVALGQLAEGYRAGGAI